jgi:hypothetical protein
LPEVADAPVGDCGAANAPAITVTKNFVPLFEPPLSVDV